MEVRMRASDRPYLPRADQPAPHGQSLLDIDWRGCIAGATSLELPEAISESAWREVGKTLVMARSATRWWVGDWWMFGEHRYGDRMALVTADDWDGPSYQTCANAAVVCRAFQTYRRREVLSFAHHAEVAGLPANEADALLDWAEEEIAATGKVRAVRALRDEKQWRQEQQHGGRVAIAVTKTPVAPLSTAVPVVISREVPQSEATQAVVARVATLPSAELCQVEPCHQGLATLMRCLKDLAAFDGARLGALVDPDKRDELLQAARRARKQLDALIGTVEASALSRHEAGKLA